MNLKSEARNSDFEFIYRLVDQSTIVDKKKRSLTGKHILITYGPTWIALDDTRTISNISSGRLGQCLVGDFAKAGCRVTALEGPVTHRLADRLGKKSGKNISIKKFVYYDEFVHLVSQELKSPYDVMIQAAAVSDYRLSHPAKTKWSSERKRIHLELVPTEKVINRVKEKNPDIFLIGFKLNSRIHQGNALAHARKLFTMAGCDLVVANSLTDDQYRGFIIDPKEGLVASRNTREALSKALVVAVQKKIAYE